MRGSTSSYGTSRSRWNRGGTLLAALTSVQFICVPVVTINPVMSVWFLVELPTFTALVLPTAVCHVMTKSSPCGTIERIRNAGAPLVRLVPDRYSARLFWPLPTPAGVVALTTLQCGERLGNTTWETMRKSAAGDGSPSCERGFGAAVWLPFSPRGCAPPSNVHGTGTRTR